MTMLIPMAFLVFYIAAVGIFTFLVRKKAVTSKQVSIKYFRVYDVRDGAPPEYMVRAARHFDNLLQAPILFLVTGMLCLFFGLNGWVTVTLGWAFVVSRLVHTWVHLGSNNILWRAASYFTGWIIILVLWTILLIHHLNSAEIVS
jgi:hypothetical protein